MQNDDQHSTATFPHDEGRSQADKVGIFTCVTGKSQNSEEGAVSFFVRASERCRKGHRKGNGGSPNAE